MKEDADPGSRSTWTFKEAGRWVHLSIERHEVAYLLLALTIFTLVAIHQDIVTPLWFDEFFTLFLSRLNSIHLLWQALPSDGQPPLQYLLTRISMRAFGESELAVRLPELLAYLVAGFCTFKIVRRHACVTIALFALALLMGAYQCQNALSARPYELLLAFTAITYLGWQTASSVGRRRIIPLCTVTLGTACMILSHHFGMIYAAALLGTGESARLLQRRKLDFGMYVAILAGLSPLVLTVPLAVRSSRLLGDAVRQSSVFWAKPSLMELRFYFSTIALPLLGLAIILALLMSIERTEAAYFEGGISVPFHEQVATVALCLILPLQLIVAKVATGYFLPRYAIGACLGVTLFCSWGLPRLKLLRNAEPAFALSILAFLTMTMTNLLYAETAHPARRGDATRNVLPVLLLNPPGDLPIVVASAYDYAPLWWYSSPALKSRLTYLLDVSYAKHQKDFLPELSLASAQEYIPLHATGYAPFLLSHPRFLLYVAGNPRLEWIQNRLVAEGWRLSPISQSGPQMLYLVQR